MKKHILERYVERHPSEGFQKHSAMGGEIDSGIPLALLGLRNMDDDEQQQISSIGDTYDGGGGGGGRAGGGGGSAQSVSSRSSRGSTSVDTASRLSLSGKSASAGKEGRSGVVTSQSSSSSSNSSAQMNSNMVGKRYKTVSKTAGGVSAATSASASSHGNDPRDVIGDFIHGFDRKKFSGNLAMPMFGMGGDVGVVSGTVNSATATTTSSRSTNNDVASKGKPQAIIVTSHYATPHHTILHCTTLLDITSMPVLQPYTPSPSVLYYPFLRHTHHPSSHHFSYITPSLATLVTPTHTTCLIILPLPPHHPHHSYVH